MKIAISSSGQNLAAQLDPRFGRCRYFLIIETDTMSFEVFDNDNAALGGGAGIQSAQFVAAKGAKALITVIAAPMRCKHCRREEFRCTSGKPAPFKTLWINLKTAS